MNIASADFDFKNISLDMSRLTDVELIEFIKIHENDVSEDEDDLDFSEFDRANLIKTSQKTFDFIQYLTSDQQIVTQPIFDLYIATILADDENKLQQFISISRGEFYMFQREIQNLLLKSIGLDLNNYHEKLKTIIELAENIKWDNSHNNLKFSDTGVESFILSKEVYSCFLHHGFTPIKTLGHGSTNVAIEAINNKTSEKVALLIDITTIESIDDRLKDIRMLQRNGILSTEYMIKIFDPIICHDRLTNKKTFWRNVYEVPSLIQVLELADITIGQHIYNLYYEDNYEEKIKFAKYFYQRYLEIERHLNDKNLMHMDLRISNMAILNNRIIAIDLESMRDIYVLKPSKTLQYTAKGHTFGLFEVLNKKRLYEIINNMDWNLINGMSKSGEERAKALKEIETSL